MIYSLVQLIFRLISFIVIVDILVSYLVPPNNRFRQVLDSIVNPLLEPIRRLVPPIQNLDFSPVILLILLQVIQSLLLGLL